MAQFPCTRDFRFPGASRKLRRKISPPRQQSCSPAFAGFRTQTKSREGVPFSCEAGASGRRPLGHLEEAFRTADQVEGIRPQVTALSLRGRIPARPVATGADTPTHRHRFTIAHELGHWLCHARAASRQYCRSREGRRTTPTAPESARRTSSARNSSCLSVPCAQRGKSRPALPLLRRGSTFRH